MGPHLKPGEIQRLFDYLAATNPVVGAGGTPKAGQSLRKEGLLVETTSEKFHRRIKVWGILGILPSD